MNRIAGWVTLISFPVSALQGVVALVDGDGDRGVGLVALAALSLVTGWAILRSDWEAPRWWVPTATSIAMLTTIALANGMRPAPYQTGLHIVTLSVWIGATRRPWQAVAHAPLYAATYWVPLQIVDAPDGYTQALPLVWPARSRVPWSSRGSPSSSISSTPAWRRTAGATGHSSPRRPT